MLSHHWLDQSYFVPQSDNPPGCLIQDHRGREGQGEGTSHDRDQTPLLK